MQGLRAPQGAAIEFLATDAFNQLGDLGHGFTDGSTAYNYTCAAMLTLSLLPPVLLQHRKHAVSTPRAQGLPAAVQAREYVRRAGQRVALAAAGAAARQLAQRPGRPLHPGPHHAAGAPSQPSKRSAAGTRVSDSSLLPGGHCQSCCRRSGAPSTWRSRASCRRCRRRHPPGTASAVPGSAAYRAQVDQIISVQANLTDVQKIQARPARVPTEPGMQAGQQARTHTRMCGWAAGGVLRCEDAVAGGGFVSEQGGAHQVQAAQARGLDPLGAG